MGGGMILDVAKVLTHRIDALSMGSCMTAGPCMTGRPYGPLCLPLHLANISTADGFLRMGCSAQGTGQEWSQGQPAAAPQSPQNNLFAWAQATASLSGLRSEFWRLASWICTHIYLPSLLPCLPLRRATPTRPSPNGKSECKAWPAQGSQHEGASC